MVENLHQSFLKPTVWNSNCLFNVTTNPKPKDMEFTIMKGSKNKQIFTF